MNKTVVLVFNNTATVSVVLNYVTEKNGKWYVMSHDGSKELGGPYDSEAAAKKRLGQIEAFKHMKQNALTSVLVQLESAKVRNEKLEGRDHMVVPAVILGVGVHNGSEGPLLYNDEELAKVPGIWDHKPIVVYHPQINGKGVTACSPSILNKSKIGLMLNTHYEGTKLKTEAWLEEPRVKKVDNRILAAIKKGKKVELSTGLFCDVEPTEGVWNGESYVGIARNFKPDHLAILPDQKGAFSIEDGGGLLANEASHDAISALICRALCDESKTTDPYYYTVDVFDTFFIYREGGKLYRRDYTNTDTKATLGTEKTEVVRVVSYQTPEGEMVANRIDNHQDRKDSNVDKELLIKSLIANGDWVEADREFLLKCETPRLQAFLKNSEALKAHKTPEASSQKNGTTSPEGTSKPPVAPVGNAAPVAKTPDQVLADYVAAAPPEIREVMTNSLNATAKEKATIVERITKNPRNQFTPDQLKVKSLDELKAIDALANPVENTQARPALLPHFGGLGDVGKVTGNAIKGPEPLVMAELDWSDRKVAK